MGRRLIATAASLAVGLVGALILAAPASATSTFKLWDVTFSEDNCSGKTVVTLVNDTDKLPHSDGIGLVFNVDGASTAVDAGTTKTVDIAWPESEDINVHLTGAYETPEVESAVKAKLAFEPVTEWNHQWKRPAGCWEIVNTSTCDNHFQIGVKNIGPDEAKFAVQVDGSTGIDQVVAAGSAWTASYNKGQSVTLVVDGKARAPITYVKPDCSTPTPSPSPSAPKTSSSPAAAPAGNDLPVTGASATLPVAGGLVLLLAAASYWVVMIRRRRKVEAGS